MQILKMFYLVISIFVHFLILDYCGSCIQFNAATYNFGGPLKGFDLKMLLNENGLRYCQIYFFVLKYNCSAYK